MEQHFWKDRPVCVTGGAGFLGYHLVQQLLDLGADVSTHTLPPTENHSVNRFAAGTKRPDSAG